VTLEDDVKFAISVPDDIIVGPVYVALLSVKMPEPSLNNPKDPLNSLSIIILFVVSFVNINLLNDLLMTI
jgi:hypothetical protein